MFNNLFSSPSGLSLGKIISGISNTLSITNKALPLIKQAGPIFNNFKKTYNTITKNSTNTNNNGNKKSTNIILKENEQKKETSSSLVFFQ